VLKADNLGTLTSWNPLGHSGPVTGLLYRYLYSSSIFIPKSMFIGNSRENLMLMLDFLFLLIIIMSMDVKDDNCTGT
jgi:hypothetical protein